jgi:hypothetical protein
LAASVASAPPANKGRVIVQRSTPAAQLQRAIEFPLALPLLSSLGGVFRSCLHIGGAGLPMPDRRLRDAKSAIRPDLVATAFDRGEGAVGRALVAHRTISLGLDGLSK